MKHNLFKRQLKEIETETRYYQVLHNIVMSLKQFNDKIITMEQTTDIIENNLKLLKEMK